MVPAKVLAHRAPYDMDTKTNMASQTFAPTVLLYLNVVSLTEI